MNDLHIAGSGKLDAGLYGDITVSGGVSAKGPLSCHAFRASGSARMEGDFTCEEEARLSGSLHCNGNARCGALRCAGSAHVEGDVHCTGEVKCSGSLGSEGEVQCDTLICAGSARIKKELQARNVTVAGSLSAAALHGSGEVSVSGGLQVEGDAEAERFFLSGGIRVGGLLNAEEMEITLQGDSSRVQSIGGRSVIVKRKRPSLRPCLLTVEDGIEADSISLECTKAQSVVGKNVVIGEKCEVDFVAYTDTLEVADNAKVGRTEKR